MSDTNESHWDPTMRPSQADFQKALVKPEVLDVPPSPPAKLHSPDSISSVSASPPLVTEKSLPLSTVESEDVPSVKSPLNTGSESTSSNLTPSSPVEENPNESTPIELPTPKPDPIDSKPFPETLIFPISDPVSNPPTVPENSLDSVIDSPTPSFEPPESVPVDATQNSFQNSIDESPVNISSPEPSFSPPTIASPPQHAASDEKNLLVPSFIHESGPSSEDVEVADTVASPAKGSLNNADTDDELSWLQGDEVDPKSSESDSFFTNLPQQDLAQDPPVDAKASDSDDKTQHLLKDPLNLAGSPFQEIDEHESSFLASLSSDRTEADIPKPALDITSTPHESTSVLQKDDPFKSIFDDTNDEDDFSAVLGKGTETKELAAGNDDDFFKSLGTSKLTNTENAQNTLGLLASLDEPKALPKKILSEDAFSKILAEDIEEEEKKASASGKVDLSKSLAFLDDDELLPDDYAEPVTSRPSSVVPPSRTHSAAPNFIHSNSAAPNAVHSNYNTPKLSSASLASNQSLQSSPYSPFSSQPHSQSHPKHPAKHVPDNAFDLPTDMVPKTIRRISSFQSPQQNHLYGTPVSPSAEPRPSIDPKKPFFDELPLMPRKPMSRNSSNSSAHFQAPHVYPPAGPAPLGGPMGTFSNGSLTSLASNSSMPLAPPRLPFAAPQRGHSRNSSGGGSNYAPSSPATANAYKPQYHNPYEPYNPLADAGAIATSVTPHNHFGPSAYQPPHPHNPYAPQVQGQRPALISRNSGQSGTASPGNAYSPSMPYASLHQKLPPPKGLQPAAPLVSKTAFGDMPADIGQKQAEFARSPEVQQAILNARHYRVSSGHDLGHPGQRVSSPLSTTGSVVHNVSPPQPRYSVSSARGYAESVASESSQRLYSVSQAPVNNETLMRRQFPIFNWGMGGRVVTVIPPSILFGGGATTTEVKVLHPSQVLKADPLIAKFPFPLVTGKGPQKHKKKDLEKWIEEHVQAMEKTLQHTKPEESSREFSRVLLWKIMLNLLQADSIITKPSKNLKEAVRKTLDPYVQVHDTEEFASFAPAVDIYRKNMHRRSSSIGTNSGKGLKSEDVNRFVDLLKVGEREIALKYALDHHLWSHALLIASSLGPSEWKDVVFEFVREEIRVFPSQSARDLALMYRIFSGAGADSVSEILPGQFTMALQDSTPGPQLTASLSNWRSTISMIFSNPSPANLEAINVFSSLLLKCGNVEASHICHLLFGTGTFGPQVGSQPSFELLGSDSSLGAGFGRDTDSILLSMVMEFFKISTEPTLPTIPYYPHLVLYKLNLTSYLADLGNITEAQSLFDSITGIVKAAGKNISYTPALFDHIDFIAQRLNLTYQDDSSAGWLSTKLGRPKLDKVLGQLDKSFSKFVTGDESASASTSVEQDGIFKRLAETPSASRVQSVVDIPSMLANANSSQVSRASAYGNPYAPVDADAFKKDPAHYQPQTAPSRSQSTVGFYNPTSNVLSPPQIARYAGDNRAMSPNYDSLRGQLPHAFNSSVALSSEMLNSGYQRELVARPKSSSTNRSRRSSMNRDGQDLQAPHNGSFDSYGAPNSQRPQANAIKKIPEERSQNPSYNAPGGSPLKNQFSPSRAPANPYAPNVRESVAQVSNPYAPTNSVPAKPAVNPYAPQNTLSSATTQHSMANTPASPQAGRKTPVMGTPKSNALLSPKSASSFSRPSSRPSSVAPIAEEGQNSQGDISQNRRFTHPSSAESRVLPESSSPYNPYAPQPASRGTNPYAPQSATETLQPGSSSPHALSNSSLNSVPANNYAPTSASAPVLQSTSVESQDPASSGGYNPYGSIYGYDSGPVSKPAEPEPLHNDSSASSQNEPEGNSPVAEEDAPETYEAPEYGFRNDDVEESEIPDDDAPQSSDNIFTPMGAPSFMPSSYSTPVSIEQEPSQANSAVEEEEEEIEDLGFANKPAKTSSEEDEDKKAKEEEVKPKAPEKEKKGGWFSWMRKGGHEEPKATQINFGEEMSLVYDPELKRYVNKNAPKEDYKPAPKLAPPPPGPSHSGPPGSSGSSGASPYATPPPPSMSPGTPPSMPGRSASAQPPSSGPMPGLSSVPSLPRSARLTPTIPSTGGGLDDLLAAAPSAGPRKTGRRNARSRYVDIMNQPKQ